MGRYLTAYLIPDLGLRLLKSQVLRLTILGRSEAVILKMAFLGRSVDP